MPSRNPNPRRVASGKANQACWRGFTAEGLRTLSEAARRNRPWEHSTGPRTAAGKKKAADNGRKRQKGPRSVREVRREMAELNALVEAMRAA